MQTTLTTVQGYPLTPLAFNPTNFVYNLLRSHARFGNMNMGTPDGPVSAKPAEDAVWDAQNNRWLSADGRHFFNGTQWQAVPAGGMAQRPGFKLGPRTIVGLLIVLGLIGYAAYNALAPKTYYGNGVTNAKIDSSTQIEFDYHADKDCSSHVFDYLFYDSSGKQVGEFSDTTGDAVQSGHDYHYTVTDSNAGESIPSSATRFVANGSCQA